MNHSTNPPFTVNGSQKIQPLHRQRMACIYVRQSSLKQVRENTESQVNQYRLEEKAKALGWPEKQIRIIDTDQGISGTSSNDRLGFQEILSLVSMSQVGIIFGYEVSRIARNNADWYPLLQLADVFGVLIADNDAIYDPKDFNDRMMLGLKGTMSELELHLIRQRLDTGRMNKIMRAEYRQPLPTGLVRERDNEVYKDPDMQVQTTIQLILDKFAELGSCSKVLRYCLDNQMLFPRRQVGGALHGETLWKAPSYTVINSMLKNPAYAGAFAHGRTQVDPAKRMAFGSPNSGRKTCAMDEWIHLQQDVYPAYIAATLTGNSIWQTKRGCARMPPYSTMREPPHKGLREQAKHCCRGWCGVVAVRTACRSAIAAQPPTPVPNFTTPMGGKAVSLSPPPRLMRLSSKPSSRPFNRPNSTHWRHYSTNSDKTMPN